MLRERERDFEYTVTCETLLRLRERERDFEYTVTCETL